MSTLTPPTISDDPAMRRILERLNAADAFAQKTLEQLPVTGDGSPRVEPQIRPAESFALTREGLDGLIKSLVGEGQVQPVIVERHDDGSLVLVAGQRRLTALRHIADEGLVSAALDGTVMALVVPGPLDPWARRAIQIAENTARKDLTATELGRMLWEGRYGLLLERLDEAGQQPPTDDFDAIINPADRCLALMDWKDGVDGLHNVGANWADVSATVGLELSEETAKSWAKQYRDLGEKTSEALDRRGASLRARREARNVVNAAGEDVAEEILAALDDFGDEWSQDSRVIEEAMRMASRHGDLDPAEIAETVITERMHASGGGSVAPTGARPNVVPEQPAGFPKGDTNVHAEDGGTAIGTVHVHAGDDSHAGAGGRADIGTLVRRLRDIDGDLADKVDAHVKQLAADLNDGATLDPADAATLILLADNLERWAHHIRDLADGAVAPDMSAAVA